MLNINEELTKSENFLIEIKPQTKTEAGEWVKNKDYLNLKLTGGDKRIINTNAGDKFQINMYYFEIKNEDKSIQKAFYEVPALSKKGEVNYIVRQMIDLELDAGHVINIIVDEKGFTKIEKVGGEKQDEKSEAVEELPTIDEEIDPKDIAY